MQNRCNTKPETHSPEKGIWGTVLKVSGGIFTLLSMAEFEVLGQDITSREGSLTGVALGILIFSSSYLREKTAK